MQSGSWNGVPLQCSVQYDSASYDQAPHWNTIASTDNSRVATGEFRIICVKASTTTEAPATTKEPATTMAPTTTKIPTTTKAATTTKATTTATTTTLSTSSVMGIQSGETIFLQTRSGNGNHIDVQGSEVQARWQSQGNLQSIVIEKQN